MLAGDADKVARLHSSPFELDSLTLDFFELDFFELDLTDRNLLLDASQ